VKRIHRLDHTIGVILTEFYSILSACRTKEAPFSSFTWSPEDLPAKKPWRRRCAFRLQFRR